MTISIRIIQYVNNRNFNSDLSRRIDFNSFLLVIKNFKYITKTTNLYINFGTPLNRTILQIKKPINIDLIKDRNNNDTEITREEYNKVLKYILLKI